MTLLANQRLALAIVLLFLVLAVVSLTVPALPEIPGNRLWSASRVFYWSGVNYPWKSYQDFGTGAWGHSGVSQATTYEEIDTDFANMAAQGIRLVKWRVFNDGRYSPEFDSRGHVTGLDDKFIPDLDAALEIAQKHEIYLVLSFFSSGFWVTDCQREGVHLGGHADVINDPAKRRSLVENAIVPLVERASRSGRVLAYEVVAEPEWGIQELNQDNDYRIKVPLANVRELVREMTLAVHLHSDSLSTLEANRASNLNAWIGLGLDYYSFSWYDWLQPYDPLDVPAAHYGMDRPVVIGEFPVAQNQYYRVSDILDLAYQEGYAGAFAWSYVGGDDYGRLADGSRAYFEWARQHWSDVAPGPFPAPADNVALLPPPYGYSKVQLGMSGKSLLVNIQLGIRDRGSYFAQLVLRSADGSGVGQQVKQVPIEGGADRLVSVRFDDLEEGQPYRVDLGIFTQDWQLQKWFQGITLLELQNQALERPDLSRQASEDPCYRAP